MMVIDLVICARDICSVFTAYAYPSLQSRECMHARAATGTVVVLIQFSYSGMIHTVVDIRNYVSVTHTKHDTNPYPSIH